MLDMSYLRFETLKSTWCMDALWFAVSEKDLLLSFKQWESELLHIMLMRVPDHFTLLWSFHGKWFPTLKKCTQKNVLPRFTHSSALFFCSLNIEW